MKKSEALTVLTAATAIDSRVQVSDAAGTAWAAVLGETDLADALAAVAEHYRVSRFPVLPADILEVVRTLRRGRLSILNPDLIHSPDGLGDREEWKWRRTLHAGIASGKITPDNVDRVRELVAQIMPTMKDPVRPLARTAIEAGRRDQPW